MRAILSTPGTTGPVIRDVDRPRIGPGEVLIEVHSTTVNPVDFWATTPEGRDAFALGGEFGLGWDFAGKVVDGGDTFTSGTPVAGVFTAIGAPLAAHAEFVVVPAHHLAVIPEGLDPAAACTAPLNTLTARQGLDLLGPAAGRTLLVTGAAGAVGGHAVGLAREDGWSTVYGLARDTDVDFLEQLGVEPVTALDDLAVDAVFDPATLAAHAMEAVVDGGDYVGVLPQFPVPSVRGVRSTSLFVEADAGQLTDLLGRTADGRLPVRIESTHEATQDGIAAAWSGVGDSGRRGRRVLRWT